jgi:UDP-2,3-diacylglucosamine pyrophosphatase LpxH
MKTKIDNPSKEGKMKNVKYQKALFVPDIHAPFHDKKWLASLLLFIKFFKPKTVFIMGDVIDFYAISRFVRNPLRALKLQEEIDSAIDVMRQIRNVAKDAKIILIRGN